MSRGDGRMPLMAGNWKMNFTHLEAIALVQKLAFTLTGKDFDATEVAVLPPFTALRSVQTLVTGDKLRIRYGAQDISPHDKGAYTGDVSGPMLAKLGCAYVLVGHSERRQYHGEDDATVNAKAMAALRSGITPIVCMGEDLAVRSTARSAASARSRSPALSSRTSRSGRSAPARSPSRRTRTRRARRSGSGFPRFTGTMLPSICVSCMAGR
jgi:triosephosphate isomerase